MIKAINLKKEYLQNPLGIDIVRPRFMWNVDGAVKQTAYQIIAKVNGKTVWNSGKVESSAMTHIPYGGSELHSRERVNWSVKLWDENGNGGEISHSFSEMGLPNASDWKAKWITGNYKVKKNERYPVDCFRKKLSVTRSVKSARLYITACGLYEARLDGKKLGNFPQVLLFGKGNKVRTVPLMEKTVEHLQQYIAVFHKEESLTSAATLFYVLHKGKKEPMNDETVRVRLQKYADSAREKCPEIPQKVHPHLWRHTRAMHLYQHGMDLSLVSQWLGHANLSTSLIYAYADTQYKREAIEKAMGGEHSGITDTTLCTVDDDALLKKLYGM